jgi:hypothetical protein
MRHGTRGRSRLDPLQPLNCVAWLVVRDQVGRILECTELAPLADLRAVLTAARDARGRAGWDAQPLGPVDGSFFASRDGVRVLVAIEQQRPRSPLSSAEPVTE